ncbi:Na+-dependent transporter [Methylacidiphilum sp. Yel]|uniref:bile acid:sodium symporter family protein n=1 Tax=Methylacidiphilum sp. Yel TaxID=1847730 RepID=UPI00106AF07D|nr:bile acid:sodium symporter [Methylacidiphilum sp. Yel]TFE68698.1 Na+-dependent transporter [Methylacidiphilum sp. Yel]
MHNSEGFLLMGLHRLFDVIHKKFFFFLILSYLLAALFPEAGLELRKITLFHWNLLGVREEITFPIFQLFILLFNGGFGVKIRDFITQFSKPLPLILGVFFNFIVPCLFVSLYWLISSLWHNPKERYDLFVGLILIIAMPIAGSTIGWSQNSNANIPLSLGLVFFSTLLSPLLTPMIFHAAKVLGGTYEPGLFGHISHQINSQFLILDIVIPSFLGMFARLISGNGVYEKVIRIIKPLNEINLLVLIYSNAATALPFIIHKPDTDFFLLIGIVVFLLCLIRFHAGQWIGSLFHFGEPTKRSLIYALGMNNNGMGLVLSNAVVGNQPSIILPIILYNLFQQIMAAAFYSSWTKKDNLVGTSTEDSAVTKGKQLAQKFKNYSSVNPP